MALIAGQVSDYIGAKSMYPGLPNAATMIGDQGYDGDELPSTREVKQLGEILQNDVQTTA